MKLEAQDARHPVYLRLKEQAIVDRESLYRKLSADLGEEQTWKLRGRIAQLTAFIDLDQPQPDIPKDHPPA